MKLLLELKALFFNWFAPNRADSNPIIDTDVKVSKKLIGFGYLDILYVWVKLEFSNSHVILLTDINVQAKNLEFWARIPKGQSIEFLKDVVVLMCKDKTELERLISNIGPEFATAYGFCAGEFITSNILEAQ